MVFLSYNHGRDKNGVRSEFRLSLQAELYRYVWGDPTVQTQGSHIRKISRLTVSAEFTPQIQQNFGSHVLHYNSASASA